MKNGNKITQWKSITRGVPQGGGLSPELFKIYMRELPQALTTESYLFADDITLSLQTAQ